MKHRSTINTLTTAALAALFLILTAGHAYAQQPDAEDEETISVKTQVARLSVAVTSITKPIPASLRWEVTHNARPRTDLIVDAPGASNPLSLVIVVDTDERKGEGWRYTRIKHELQDISSVLHLQAAPRVVVASDASARLPLELPKNWPVTYKGDTRSAFNEAMDMIEHSPGTRRALLVITNRVGQLPAHIFEDADARLAQTAAFIYLMTVAPPKVKYGTPGCVVARTNLNTLENLHISVEADYVGAQFKFFTRLANSLYVVSYPLGEQESAPGTAQDAQITAVSTATGQPFITQRRRFNVN